MVKRVQKKEGKAKNQTARGTFLLYEAACLWRDNGSSRNYFAILVKWGSWIFFVLPAGGNIFVVDKRTGCDVLGGNSSYTGESGVMLIL